MRVVRPEGTLPTPFDIVEDDCDRMTDDVTQPTRTLIELEMIGLSASLREKPEWWRKYKLEDVRARWKNEALEQGLSDAQVEYVLDELTHYDSLRVEATGIEVSCYDGIWQSDRLIAPDVRQALQDGVRVLEDVPEELKDWHPRSNGLVLDLVHPSLYPLVYGRTLVRSSRPRHKVIQEAFESTHQDVWNRYVSSVCYPGHRSRRDTVHLPLHDDPKEWSIVDLKHWLTQTPESEVDDATWLRKAEAIIDDSDSEDDSDLQTLLVHWRLLPTRMPFTGLHRDTISARFAWLPTDFAVDAAGRATALGYINNLHPANSTLTQAVEDALSAFVPLFERVLADLQCPHPLRVQCWARRTDGIESPHMEDGETDDAWRARREEWDAQRNYPVQQPGETGAAFARRYDDWNNGRKILLPIVPKYGEQPQPADVFDDRSSFPQVGPAGEVSPQCYSLRDRKLQVIVKLANIILTPGKPEYSGGSWHVEGMLNERIVASGIYYYDECNITESRLAFRTAVREPSFGYEQNDEGVCLALFGIPDAGDLVQSLGSVQTKADRCIAFPNVFQHCVSPFKLADPSRPGHRKILALFLVDPAHTIPSTSTVVMQQRDWVLDAISSFGPGNRLHRLPRELLDMIADFTATLISHAEAIRYREELMDERTRFVETNNERYFGAKFNMCEH